MKNSLQILIVFLFLAFASVAQMKEGKMVYDMVFTNGNQELSMVSDMMKGSTTTLEFIPGATRSEISLGMMGANGTIITIVNEQSGQSLLLSDGLGVKYAIKSDLTKPDTSSFNYKVETATETKDIFGFTCKKAILSSENGGKVIIWYTNDIEVFNQGQKFYNSEMPGFPLSLIIKEEGLTVEMTLTKLEKSVDKSHFSMEVPEGYELQTDDELNSGEQK